jgi:hypothetical protein
MQRSKERRYSITSTEARMIRSRRQQAAQPLHGTLDRLLVI